MPQESMDARESYGKLGMATKFARVLLQFVKLWCSQRLWFLLEAIATRVVASGGHSLRNNISYVLIFLFYIFGFCLCAILCTCEAAGKNVCLQKSRPSAK